METAVAVVMVVEVMVVEVVVVVESLENGLLAFVLDLIQHLKLHLPAIVVVEDFVRVVVVLVEVAYCPARSFESLLMVTILGHTPDHKTSEVVVPAAVTVVTVVVVVDVGKVVVVLLEIVLAKVTLSLYCPVCC